MKLSIIVPIYRVEPFLDQCLNSLMVQTLEDVEILLVDDGSPDGCPTICDKYASRDKRMRVIHKKNGGLVSARQRGFQEARGEYIGFVDGDDWIEPDMFAQMLALAEREQADVVQCEFYREFSDRTERSEQHLGRETYSRTELEAEVFPRMIFGSGLGDFGIVPSCWSKLFHRRVLENTLTRVDQRIRMGEDAAFTYPALAECKTLCYINRPLYHYRISAGSMTKSYDPEYWSRVKCVFAGLSGQANRLGMEDFQRQLGGYFLYLANFAIRNECSPANRQRGSRAALARAVTAEPCLKGIVLDRTVPAHIKVVHWLIRHENKLGMRLYLELFSLYQHWSDR